MPLENLRAVLPRLFAKPQVAVSNLVGRVKTLPQQIQATGQLIGQGFQQKIVPRVQPVVQRVSQPLKPTGIPLQSGPIRPQLRQRFIKTGRELQRFPSTSYSPPILKGNQGLARPIIEYATGLPGEIVRSYGRTFERAGQGKLAQGGFGERFEDISNILPIIPVGRISTFIPKPTQQRAIAALNGLKNFDKFSNNPTAQMQIDTNVQKIAKELIPNVVGSKEMRRLSTANPIEWRKTIYSFLQDKLSQAKNPIPNIGLTTRNILGKTSEIPLGQKERGFVTTVKQSPTTTPQIATKVQGAYTPITNQATLQGAQRVVNENYDIAKQRVINEPLSADTNVIGQEIMRRAQNEGRFDEAIEIAETLAKKGTEAGQSIQAFSIWSRLTPEGMLRYGAKSIQQATENRGIVDKAFGRIPKNLTPEDSKLITGFMKKAQIATTPEEQTKFTKLAMEVINEKIPYGIKETFDTFRLNNILSNPRSHMRNIWGNLLNTYITRPTQLAFEGRPVEALKYEAAALKALPDAIDDAIKGFKGEITDLGKLDVQTLQGKKAPLLISGALRTLEATDRFFLRLIQNGEVSRGKTSEQAKQFAEQLLYRSKIGENKAQGYFLNFLDNSIGGLLKFASRTPAINWFVPFARTPFNVAKMQLEFSPAGLATIPGAQDKRAQVAKAAIGSMATLFGGKLALEGRTTFAPPTDPDAKELFYGSGKRPFSIQVGDKWIPSVYFGPLGLALMLPAMHKWYNEDAPTALTSNQIEKITQTIQAMIFYWSQQTPLSGIGSFIDIARGNTDINVLKNLGFTASQVIPYTGLLNYVAQKLDPIYRKPQGFGEQIISGIPGLSKNIERFYSTPKGEPSTRPPSHFILPYTLGTQEKEYEAPLQSRQTRLQENKVFSEMASDFNEIEDRTKKMIEAGNVEGAKALITENKEVFRKGLVIKEAKKRVRGLQDMRDKAAKDDRLTIEQKQKVFSIIEQETQKHFQLLNTL